MAGINFNYNTYVNCCLQYARPPDSWFSHVEFLISQRRTNEVISILNSGPSTLNTVDATGQTLLYVATKHHNLKVMEYLIRAGCNVNTKDIFGWTPLMIAAKSKDPRPAEMLLHCNADIFETNSNAQSALHIYLNQYIFEHPKPALELFFEKVRSRSANIEHMVAILKTADCHLEAIVHFRDAELTKRFLDQQSYFDYFESSYSVLACMKFGYEKNLRVLLRYGVGVEMRRAMFLDYFYDFWSKMEVSKASLEMIEVFVRMLIDCEFFDQRTAEFVDDLFYYSTEEQLRVIVQSGINSYIKKEFGYEPIVYIFANSNPNVLKLIDEEKIDLNGRDREGKTSLHVAVEYEVEEHVSYLLEVGVDPNVMNYSGLTPIFYTYDGEGHFVEDSKCVALLLKYGVDFQVCDEYDCTFIEYVEYTEGCKDIFQLILAHFAMLHLLDVPIKDSIMTYINSHENMKTYYEKMCQQLESMKTREICRSLTLFSALTQSKEFISRHIRSIDSNTIEGLVFYAKFNLGEYDSYYTDILRERLLTAYSICKTRDKAASVICDCIPILRYYFVVVDKICSFLMFDDLHNIAYPFHKPNYK